MVHIWIIEEGCIAPCMLAIVSNIKKKGTKNRAKTTRIREIAYNFQKAQFFYFLLDFVYFQNTICHVIKREKNENT